ncbi:MAG: sugar transferase [Abditibacteriota bacterium]|nr:sugar transferase [Abditibacteriota bacterium]
MDFSRTKGFYNLYGKRIFDLLFAIVLFCLFFWVYLFIAIIIVATDGFPIFYRGLRGGFHNKSFRIIKFRTMVKNAEKIGGGTTALNDTRITKIGRILRKTKLDEIPQIFNVIRGEMSFVGPRPELLQYTSKYEGDEKYILEVRPGITDYSSLAYISLDEIVGEEDVDRMYEEKVLKRKNRLRMKYVSEICIKTDFILFFKTISKTFRKSKEFVVDGKSEY